MASDKTRKVRVPPGPVEERGSFVERRGRSRSKVPALTILFHPNAHRVGERALLGELAAGRPVSLSRYEPGFVPPGEESPRGLDDPYLSRKAVHLAPGEKGGLCLHAQDAPIPLEADGRRLEDVHQIPAADLEAGVILTLAGRVVLLLHTLNPKLVRYPEDFGLVGESEGIQRLRQDIARVADLEVPVLLRGETGTGKELVARAIHQASRRREEVCLSVNLGAIAPTLALAELFGSVKGAFTGAVRSRAGYFQRAHGGTLFLDEVGETPAEVQVMLLRALETGEVHAVGSHEPQTVDVRVVAATDSDLHAAIEANRFKAPLLHRLAGYEIVLPPLRERRDDFGRLLFHFLRRELAETGEEDRLELAEPTAQPWLPASIVARLARHPWPGNVRQLRNAARQLAIASRGASRVHVSPQIEELLRTVDSSAGHDVPTLAGRVELPETDSVAPSPAASDYRSPSEVGREELLAALRANRWQVKPTAEELGVSRASLYLLMEQTPGIRKAGDLSRTEIEECREACGGDLERMVDYLEVSASGLKQRMRHLGLDG